MLSPWSSLDFRLRDPGAGLGEDPPSSSAVSAAARAVAFVPSTPFLVEPADTCRLASFLALGVLLLSSSLLRAQRDGGSFAGVTPPLAAAALAPEPPPSTLPLRPLLGWGTESILVGRGPSSPSYLLGLRARASRGGLRPGRVSWKDRQPVKRYVGWMRGRTSGVGGGGIRELVHNINACGGRTM